MAPGPEPVLQWQPSLLGFTSNVRGNSKVPAIGLLQASLWQKKARIWEGQAEAPKALTAREKP